MTSSQRPEIVRSGIGAGLIFAAVAAFLLTFHANQLIFSPDEGIMFEAAQRMLAGKRLYVDFFGYMSPGSYWLQELVFRWLGPSLRSGRLIVIVDFALQCALIFWLISRAGHRLAACAAAVLFFVLEAGNPGLILPGHRWDSAALSLLSVALCVQSLSLQKWLPSAAAGVLITFAAFCTPSIAILIPITAATALVFRRRRFLLPYLAAAGLTAACILAIMQGAGYLAGFIEQMLWLSRHYSVVNITPYGWPLGGFAAFFQGLGNAPWILRPLLLITAMLPAILPVLAVVGWGTAWALRKRLSEPPEDRSTIFYLLLCLAGYVVSTEPRPDMTHLTIVSPLAYVLVTWLTCAHVPRLVRAPILLVLLPCAVLTVLASTQTISASTLVPTPVGALRVSAQEEPALRNLLSSVRPGQSLYVHPYLPLFYFLTQAVNPTRFSYLAPGMMGPQEESAALKELQQSPPDWILYLPLRREDYLRVFPSAAGLDLHYPAIECWIQDHYAPLEKPVWISAYQLLARKNPRDLEVSRIDRR